MSSVLVVGTVAFDDIETPFGRVERAIGGSATHFSSAASIYAPVNLVSIVGTDFALSELDYLRARAVDLRGLEVVEGDTFHWSGRYDYDLNVTETRFTKLNVYAAFAPKLPEGYAESEYVFLANMDPVLQREVLGQTKRPKLAVMDTMNFWIDAMRDELIETMRDVDMVTMNESEARMLAGTNALHVAARYVLSLGPRALLLKKGEHGAVMFMQDEYFVAPAYPLEEVYDPTGAGDSFAGGFMGYLASKDSLATDDLRRAVIHGSAVASFQVEDFSVNRMRTLTRPEIDARYAEFHEFTRFEALP